jgi:hypothetical protein
MKSRYGITIDDAGLNETQLVSYWEQREAPNEIVGWLAKKYELIPITSHMH